MVNKGLNQKLPCLWEWQILSSTEHSVGQRREEGYHGASRSIYGIREFSGAERKWAIKPFASNSSLIY